MSAADSISQWYNRLQAGDTEAARVLWDLYFPRLVGLARARLAGLARRAAADEEDVALSAFDSFCRRAASGGFPDVRDRDDLWRVLATVTARKAARLVRDERAQKRGAGAVAGESAFDRPGGPFGGGLEDMAGRELPPALEVELADDFVQLLDALGDDELRRIALWKMEGYANAEICGFLGCAPATVERRLALIRKTWEETGAEPPDASN